MTCEVLNEFFFCFQNIHQKIEDKVLFTTFSYQRGYITKLKKKMIGCTLHIESFPMVL